MSSKSSLPRESPPGPPSQWLKSHLVGISSAAVLAVYAAGFERTRAAAARFSDEAASRRRAAPIRTTGEIGARVPRPPAPAHEAPAPAAAMPGPERRVARETAQAAPRVASTTAEPAAPTAEKPAPEPPVVVATPPARDSTPAPPKAAEIVATPKPAAPPKPAAQAAQSDTAQPVRKDGTYTGWGTSRHGDIQATVQIKDGKIVLAAISECLTRYSCSWIALLPPQVIARQSAEVDVVSGATESTNAFYYAIVEALNKAK